MHPASVSSIASSFLFPRPVSPVPLPQPALVLSVPPTDALASEAAAVVPQSFSSIEKSVAEKPFDEVSESVGSDPLPPPPLLGPRTPSSDPIVALISEAGRLLNKLSIAVQNSGSQE